MPSRKRRRKKRRALRILVVVLGMLAVVGLVAGTLWLIVVQLDKLALWPFGQSETASSTAPPTVLTTTGAPPAQTTTAAATATTTTTTTTRPKTTTRGPAATVDAQDLNRKLDDILNKNGRTPKAIYDYVHGHMTYKTMARGSSYEEMALYAIKYGKGSCYQFTALTYLLLKRAGYDADYIGRRAAHLGDGPFRRGLVFHRFCVRAVGQADAGRSDPHRIQVGREPIPAQRLGPVS